MKLFVGIPYPAEVFLPKEEVNKIIWHLSGSNKGLLGPWIFWFTEKFASNILFIWNYIFNVEMLCLNCKVYADILKTEIK